MSKKLKNLLHGFSFESTQVDENQKVKFLTHDSREVYKGGLFFALKGLESNGEMYALSAISKGALAVVTEAKLPHNIPQIIVEDVRSSMSLIAKAFYGNACDKMVVIGITGTNGKTTTSHMIAHVLRSGGYKVGLIGTLGAYIDGERLPCNLTTPDPIELHKLFLEMLSRGVSHVVMECSAHAIHLKKLTGITFRVGIFTNLSQDHLDFFKDYRKYCDTKVNWFDERMEAVITNVDDEEGKKIKGRSYSLNDVSDLELYPDKTHFSYGDSRFALNMPAEFNVYNALATILTCQELGVNIAAIQSALATLPQISGRFNTIDVGGVTIIIDYSHTPDSLRNILIAARGLVCDGCQLISVFGCGGDRDKDKREKMGVISGELADFSFVTSDNPRSEAPEMITLQIMAGIQSVTENFIIEVDRTKAIHMAIKQAKPGDIVVIAGKGGEEYTEIKGERVLYSDNQVVDTIRKGL